MSKTILADVDGFTPIIDRIAIDLGLMSAAVFGRMWRYCQMRDGVCSASSETIAKTLGIDRATVQRHQEKLCKAGYLIDLSPMLRNKPHKYADTGKAGMKVSIGVAITTDAQRISLPENGATDAQRITADAQRITTDAQSRMKIGIKTPIKEMDDSERLVRAFEAISADMPNLKRQKLLQVFEGLQVRAERHDGFVNVFAAGLGAEDAEIMQDRYGASIARALRGIYDVELAYINFEAPE